MVVRSAGDQDAFIRMFSHVLRDDSVQAEFAGITRMFLLELRQKRSRLQSCVFAR